MTIIDFFNSHQIMFALFVGGCSVAVANGAIFAFAKKWTFSLAQKAALQVLTGLTALVVSWHYGAGLAMIAVLGFTWILLALSFIDSVSYILPDVLTLGLMWAGLGVNAVGLFTDAPAAILGAMLGYLSLWAVGKVFLMLRGHAGVGYGDYKLFAALGAWLGPQALAAILFLASLFGCVVMLTLTGLKRRHYKDPFAFGPYLAGAGWIVMLFCSSFLRTGQKLEFTSLFSHNFALFFRLFAF